MLDDTYSLPLGAQSAASMTRLATELVIRESGLVDDVAITKLPSGHRITGRIDRWWWLTLGIRHLLIRHRVRKVLPSARRYCGYTLSVSSLRVL